MMREFMAEVDRHKRRAEYALRLPPPWLNGKMLIVVESRHGCIR
jgi:hypothetical protein